MSVIDDVIKECHQYEGAIQAYEATLVLVNSGMPVDGLRVILTGNVKALKDLVADKRNQLQR